MLVLSSSTSRAIKFPCASLHSYPTPLLRDEEASNNTPRGSSLRSVPFTARSNRNPFFCRKMLPERKYDTPKEHRARRVATSACGVYSGRSGSGSAGQDIVRRQIQVRIVGWWKTRTQVDVDGLGVAVCFKTSFTKFTTNAALLHTTEGDVRLRVLCRVDPNHTSLNLSSNTVGTLNVLCKDSSAETVGRVVGELESLCFITELGDDYHRAKDFLTEDTHLVVDVAKDSGLDEEALLGRIHRLSTSEKSGTLGLSNLDILEDAVVLLL
ncbi:hypothetical protein HG531_000494 [Fusarium graminearum]|nr:hypothetical protein HG531_000494 [Fusarium graminearum]